MSNAVTFDAARTLAQLTQNLDGYSRAGTMSRVVESARLTLDCTEASLWHLSGPGGLQRDASTDPVATKAIAKSLAKDLQGPMWDAVTTRAVVVCRDFGSERRWPARIEQLMAISTTRSAVVYPLGRGSHDSSVLALHSEQPGYFTPEVVQVGETFAIHASSCWTRPPSPTR